MTQLGKYQLFEVLGKGSFGTVYRALDTSIGRSVAVKVLNPFLAQDEQFFQRFRKEALAASDLFHQHIATIIEFNEAEGRYFLVMRYIEGRSLDAEIKARGALPWDEALSILKDIAGALDYAHQRGLIHRDIKPANILLGKKDGAVLTDFGLVRFIESTGLTTTSAVLGTPPYIPAEIWEGAEVTPAADIYSLGCVFFEMITGKVLFEGVNTPQILQRHILKGPEFPARWAEGIPEGVDAVLQKALERDPARRYPGAGQFYTALQALGAHPRPGEAATSEPLAPQVKPVAVPPAVEPPLAEKGPLPAKLTGTSPLPTSDEEQGLAPTSQAVWVGQFIADPTWVCKPPAPMALSKQEPVADLWALIKVMKENINETIAVLYSGNFERWLKGILTPQTIDLARSIREGTPEREQGARKLLTRLLEVIESDLISCAQHAAENLDWKMVDELYSLAVAKGFINQKVLKIFDLIAVQALKAARDAWQAGELSLAHHSAEIVVRIRKSDYEAEYLRDLAWKAQTQLGKIMDHLYWNEINKAVAIYDQLSAEYPGAKFIRSVDAGFSQAASNLRNSHVVRNLFIISEIFVLLVVIFWIATGCEFRVYEITFLIFVEIIILILSFYFQVNRDDKLKLLKRFETDGTPPKPSE